MGHVIPAGQMELIDLKGISISRQLTHLFIMGIIQLDCKIVGLDSLGKKIHQITKCVRYVRLLCIPEHRFTNISSNTLSVYFAFMFKMQGYRNSNSTKFK